MTMYVRLGRALGALGLVSLLLSGCGDNPLGRRAISVKVTVAGQPLEHGTILFTPTPTGPSYQAGGTITQGSLEIPALQGLPPGEYNVGVSVASGKPDPTTKGSFRERAERVPPEFNVGGTLKFTVSDRGKNEFSLDIPRLIN